MSPSPVLRAFVGHEGKSPRGLAAPDGGVWIATGGFDGVRIFDPRSGALLRRLPGDRVHSMAASADASHLLWSDGRGVLRLRMDGRAEAPERIVSHRSEDLALSRDGARLAVVRPYERVELYDATVDPPAHLRTLTGPGRIAGLDLTDDGARLVSGAWRGRGVRCWDTATGEVLFDRLSEERQVSASFDGTGTRVLAAASDAMHVWDAKGESALTEPLAALRSFESAGTLDASPDGRRVAGVVDRATVELRDGTSLEVLGRLWSDGTALQSILLVPASDLLLIGTNDGRALVWDLERLEAELGAIGLGLRSRWPGLRPR
jgi:WD40 repeat protein